MTDVKKPIEDWTGCDLENAGRFEVMRAFNGIVVRAAPDYSRDTVYFDKLLVFQNPEHFWSWLQTWLDKTRSSGT